MNGLAENNLQRNSVDVVDFIAVGFLKSQQPPGSTRPSLVSDSENESHFSTRSNFCGTQANVKGDSVVSFAVQHFQRSG
jgi:hypothetical protein